jgi:hypothetical protein
LNICINSAAERAASKLVSLVYMMIPSAYFECHQATSNTQVGAVELSGDVECRSLALRTSILMEGYDMSQPS